MSALKMHSDPLLSVTPRTAMVIAGGTGGHIFPGLALAGLLRDRGWNVHWVGGKSPSMESKLVPAQGFDFQAIDFTGVRGKGLLTLLELPIRLIKAVLQSYVLIRNIRPDVLVGLGGYITVPPCLVGRLLGKPLVLHEQNSVPGSANKLLSKIAQTIFTAFPGVLNGNWVGNPLRNEFKNQPTPSERLANRVGPLRLLVVGGSLGAHALNSVVPQALAMMPAQARPYLIHQGGAKQIDTLRAAYKTAGLTEGEYVQLVPFIDEMAKAFMDADIVICRAGASTVSELAALGVAAIYVPFPHAIDDHQTVNAKFMVDSGAGWLMEQKELTPSSLCKLLMSLNRDEILSKSECAYAKKQTDAAERVVIACEEIVN